VFEDSFQTLVKLASGKQNTMLAVSANQANIRPQSDDLPIIAAAGMLFSQTDNITQLYLFRHKP
jgi:hypothetical protein